jgi:hypothetical protein
MAQAGQRKCLCCGEFFDPDHRNRERQRYCAAPGCRRASHAVSQAAWLAKPQNQDYFRDPLHVAKAQAWRIAHPGYSRSKPRKARSQPALQDALIPQVPDLIEETSIRGRVAVPPALQDALEAPSPLLAGLIVHLFELTLQEDIAATTRRLVQLGHDAINRAVHRSPRHEDSQTRAVARAAAPGTQAIQLD